MNSSPTKEKAAQKSEVDKSSADPFASDIFAGGRLEEAAETENAPRVETEKPAWVWRLPKAAKPSVDWNAKRRRLPADFSAELPSRLADALARILDFRAEHPIEFLFLTEREVSEITGDGSDSWWLSFGLTTAEASFAVEIDDVFAVWLVDAMLGEKKSDRAKVRELTASEIAVLEFLAVNLAHEANEIISAPLFKFRALSRKKPALLNQKKNKDAENNWLAANWQTIHGFLNSIVKIYAAPETFDALDANQNKILSAQPRHRKIWNALRQRVKNVRARISLGETLISLSDAAGLETGDIVLPENHFFSIDNGELSGQAEIFLGDGEHIKISGAFTASENVSLREFSETNASNADAALLRRIQSNQPLRLSVERFDEADDPQFFEKSMSNEEIGTNEIGETPNEDYEAGSGIQLENLAVTLRVELEARRLSLEEVEHLRINQIIELGVSAADPVNLLIDNKVVARGELVEVENRLGVRIIQILR